MRKKREKKTIWIENNWRHLLLKHIFRLIYKSIWCNVQWHSAHTTWPSLFFSSFLFFHCSLHFVNHASTSFDILFFSISVFLIFAFSFACCNSSCTTTKKEREKKRIDQIANSILLDKILFFFSSSSDMSHFFVVIVLISVLSPCYNRIPQTLCFTICVFESADVDSHLAKLKCTGKASFAYIFWYYWIGRNHFQ